MNTKILFTAVVFAILLSLIFIMADPGYMIVLKHNKSDKPKPYASITPYSLPMPIMDHAMDATINNSTTAWH